ncbi:morphogenic membrane protein MmpA [Streptomyces fuscichromogenes]
MTTHRAPESVAYPAQSAGRAVNAALVLSVVAGFAWIAGMLYTVLQWQA